MGLSLDSTSYEDGHSLRYEERNRPSKLDNMLIHMHSS